MRASSLKLATEHGIISPQKYRDSLIHDWYVPDEFKKHLKIHFLAKELAANLRNNMKNGELVVGNHTYNVVWVNKPETIYKDKYVLLSFRYCRHLDCGYVLIKKYEVPTTKDDVIPLLEYNREVK